jgi:hypothetical protein
MGMAAAMALVVFVGFAPTYYLRPRFVPEPLPLYLHVHGLVFSAWIVLLAAQSMLIATRRTAMHRRLGWMGAVLGALVVVAGTTAAVLSGRSNIEAGFDDSARTFLAVPLFSMAVFLTLVSAAIVFRGRPQAHKRLMLLATINLLDAPIARWPGAPETAAVYVIADLFIAAIVLYDLASRRRLDASCLWGGTLVVAGQALRHVVGPTPAWHALASSLIG